MNPRSDNHTLRADGRGAPAPGADILHAIGASLAAFAAAAIWPRTPLAKAVVLVLVIKLIGIAGIKMIMFPDNAQPVVDAAGMARAIGPAPPPQ
jgi:hypothetical protein